MFNISQRFNEKKLIEFAGYLQDLSRRIGFKVSARGWAYILETERIINKDEFDKVNAIINKCRKKGYLQIDFTAEDDARQFKGVETASIGNVVEMFGRYVEDLYDTPYYFTPDWWKNEKYYIQMVVEKIDLVTLFEPTCSKFHIPIANSKGWSSMLQRANYSRRYKEAQNEGLKPVLLYCGDHDPDGLRISEFIRKNLEDLKDIIWKDGLDGYDPKDLIIHRFGLNNDFIQENSLTWIDNLITGSGKNLASPKHKNYKMPYVQDYLHTFGAKKCEANALVTIPKKAKELVEKAITNFLGIDAIERFEAKKQVIEDEFNTFLDKTGTRSYLTSISHKVEDYDNDNLDY